MKVKGMTAKALHKTAIMTCAIDVSCLMSYSKHVDVQRYTRTSIMKPLIFFNFSINIFRKSIGLACYLDGKCCQILTGQFPPPMYTITITYKLTYNYVYFFLSIFILLVSLYFLCLNVES